LIALTVSSPMFAQGTSFGRSDCGQWVNATQVQRQQRQAWLLGWLSGTNNAIEARTPQGQALPDYLGQLSSVDQAYLFVDNYCRANPLNNVADAADQLMVDLIAKKHKK
jgi:hypothetical protein